VFAAAGTALLVRGAFIVMETIRPSQWPEILIWMAAGILLHDLVLAPVSLLLGRVLRPGPVIAAGWLGTGVVLLLAYPLLKGAQVRQNPTVIPYAPGPELIRALATVLACTILAWTAGRVVSRRVRHHRSQVL
jgi:hypothetical protein